MIILDRCLIYTTLWYYNVFTKCTLEHTCSIIPKDRSVMRCVCSFHNPPLRQKYDLIMYKVYSRAKRSEQHMNDGTPYQTMSHHTENVHM
jgi:hypothetical protein